MMVTHRKIKVLKFMTLKDLEIAVIFAQKRNKGIHGFKRVCVLTQKEIIYSEKNILWELPRASVWNSDESQFFLSMPHQPAQQCSGRSSLVPQYQVWVCAVACASGKQRNISQLTLPFMLLTVRKKHPSPLQHHIYAPDTNQDLDGGGNPLWIPFTFSSPSPGTKPWKKQTVPNAST